jgi:WD40 repeat protein
VTSLLFLDSDRLVSGAKDGNLTVWVINSGRKMYEEKVHAKRISCIIDLGNMFALSSWDSIIKIWDKSSYKCINILQGHSIGVT